MAGEAEPQERLQDVFTPEEWKRIWHDVQFGKASGITWVQIIEEKDCASHLSKRQ